MNGWICTPYQIMCVEWLPVTIMAVVGIALLVIFILLNRFVR
jgi:hypothetical protein